MAASGGAAKTVREKKGEDLCTRPCPTHSNETTVFIFSTYLFPVRVWNLTALEKPKEGFTTMKP